MKRGAYILPYFDHLPKEFEVGTPIVTTDVPLNSTYINLALRRNSGMNSI